MSLPAKDERIEALAEVANDEGEHEGWVKLAQDALDLIAERDQTLRSVLELLTAPYAGNPVPVAVKLIEERIGK